ALDQLIAIGDIEPTVGTAKEGQRLLAGEAGPQVHVAGDVGEPPVDVGRMALRVQAKDLRAARGGANEPEQQADGSRLARDIRPQVAQHLAAIDLERKLPEREG